MENQQQLHVLLVTYPAQGHINPSLQFAKRLIRLGIQVTFVTSIFAHRRMTKASGAAVPKGMNFAVFSDGYDEGFKLKNIDGQQYMSEMKRRGSDALRDVIIQHRHDSDSSTDSGRPPIKSLVYSLLLPWAAEVAREFHIPSALLWIQPATVLDIYYYYFFSGYGDEIKNNGTDPYWKVQFPGLPLLESRDLPSFIVPSNNPTSDNYSFVLSNFKSQLDILNDEEDDEIKPTVLVNTFDALESEALTAIDKYNMIAIGPLVSLDGYKNNSTHAIDACFSFGNLFEETKDYKEWLNSKPMSSVIYVSFGSLLNLEKEQMVEIARALLDSGRPFLWVIRDYNEKEEYFLDDQIMIQEKGMIVPWCSQVDVLTHPSLGCFMTHCGWNSTLESVVYGVPVIAFPQWTDQGTNAKLLESVCETGVRVRVSTETGIVERDEIKKCIEEVMEEDGGRKGMELRKNAKKWKDLAWEAMREGGSSDKNLKTFLEHVGDRYSGERVVV